MANDNMKWTRELIRSQSSVLSSVIQHLDLNGQSNSKIRELVDQVLNHYDSVIKLSREELDEAENYQG